VKKISFSLLSDITSQLSTPEAEPIKYPTTLDRGFEHFIPTKVKKYWEAAYPLRPALNTNLA
jgi:hypothetical protein